MKRPSDTISFRADSDLTRLIDSAREPFGISRGDWVRGVVLGHLHRGDAQELNDQLADLRTTLDRLLEDVRQSQQGLSRMLFAVLTLIGRMPPEEAKAIVHKVYSS